MTRLFNDPATFSEDMLAGFLDANSRYVVGVSGGVVRASETSSGKVAVVVGGGAGHYPAFCGVVGPGFADGAVVGNIFTSPSAAEAASVARAAHGDAGVLLLTGNYAGDVMNFGLAVKQLRDERIDARYLVVTDDIASAPPEDTAKRRGIAGDFSVFRCASAAAEEGADLDTVERIAAKANEATRTLGVAFDGCTMPGADRQLFTVAPGTMDLGLGIHGEPGVSSHAMPTAAELRTARDRGARRAAGRRIESYRRDPQWTGPHQVRRTVRGVEDGQRAPHRSRPHRGGTRSRRTRHQPRHGGLLADRDLARRRTRAVVDRPADTPAYRKGRVIASDGTARVHPAQTVDAVTVQAADSGGRASGSDCCRALSAIAAHMVDVEHELGPHRRGRRRRRPRPRHGQGNRCGRSAAMSAVRQGAGTASVLTPRAKRGPRRPAAPPASCGARHWPPRLTAWETTAHPMTETSPRHYAPDTTPS